MSQVNIQRLIDNISDRNNNVYTPIVEGIVNAIQSIEANKDKNGFIEATFVRSAQLSIDGDSLGDIVGVKIMDNGKGFNDINRNSFDTLYSDLKIKEGGKGFGRFSFLKYFNKVKINSIFEGSDGRYKRSFIFSPKQNFIEGEKIVSANGEKIETQIILENLKEQYLGKIDKKLETIARQLCERLLIYFIDEHFNCPKIIINVDDNKIVLNDYINEFDQIKEVGNKEIILGEKDGQQRFIVKIFKVFFTQNTSSVLLTAHNRLVTKEPIHRYIPEFKDDFYEERPSNNGEISRKNYSIMAYVLGDYLDENVLLERDDFKFKYENDLLHPISRKQIENEATNLVKEIFKDDVLVRQNKKIEQIRSYIDHKAPWHKSYYNEINISQFPYNADEETMEAELQRIKFSKDLETKSKVAKLLKETKPDQISEGVEKITEELTQAGKADLAHYVALRKVVLEVLKKSLEWDQDTKYSLEKMVHSLIFPLNKSSDDLKYEDHNLWILDERLSFHTYLASDKKLPSDKRPDILIFDKPIVVRENNELSNPITIFEFKRPQREDYDDDEDPIKQMFEYVEEIRLGKLKTIKGRNIVANGNTPAYAYLICDITEKIKSYCKVYSLTMSPDEKGYYGYHSSYKIYTEVISFEKLLQDAELRNKIFFEKLHI